LGAPVLREDQGPSISGQDARFCYFTGRHQLPRERFSRVPSMFDSLGVEVPYPT
jgi:hypothetical protein